MADAKSCIGAGADGNGNLRFGLGRMDILAADLRALADAIDGNRVVVKRIEVNEVGESDDFPTSYLTLVYHEFQTKKDKPHE